MTKELADFIVEACNNSNTLFGLESNGVPELVEVNSMGCIDYGILFDNIMSVTGAIAAESFYVGTDSEDADDNPFFYDLPKNIANLKIKNYGLRFILY